MRAPRKPALRSAREPRPLRRVGLTGGIATGKSHVRAEFERLGVPTIDADLLARDAVAPGTPGLSRVVERFGPAVIGPDGALNRKKLASIVFSDAQARRDLEAIVHPQVRAATDRWFASLHGSSHAFAVADIPLLYEVGLETRFDAVIVVACDEGTQRRRVVERDGVSDAEARRRIGAQLPIDEKVRRADYVIWTDASLADTTRQVQEVCLRVGGG